MANKPATPVASAPVSAALSFEDTAVPAVTREPKDNPFAGVAKALADNRESAKSFTVPNDEVAYHIRLAQNAGKAVDVTIRNKREAAGDTATKVTIWAVDAIKRPRKG